MSSSARWSIVAVIIVAALVAALWSTLGSAEQEQSARDAGPAAPGASGGVTPGPYRPADAALRSEVGLPACPTGQASGAGAASGENADAAAAGPLGGVALVCMSDGEEKTFAEIAAGTPTLINLWAYWCEPCRRELPALRDAQAELGDSAQVVLVHADPDEAKGLEMLQELGVTELPSLVDAGGDVAEAAGAPPVLPVNILVAPDGTVAKVLPQVMRGPGDVVDAVDTYLGQEVS